MAGLNKSDICVLIPAYNEAGKLPGLLKAIRKAGYPVVVCDDGSSDATVECAKKVSGVTVLTTERNRGKGSAIRRGIAWFLGSPYAAAVFMDADGQHDPVELELFYDSLKDGRWEVVIGNRMGAAGSMPPVRRLTNRLMSAVLSAMAGQKIPDTQCGYRAFTRRALQTLVLRANHFEIESEMLLAAARRGFALGSVGVACRYQGERSRIRPVTDTLRFFKFLLKAPGAGS